MEIEDMFKYKITIEIKSTDEEKLKDWIGWFMDNNTLKCSQIDLDHSIEIEEVKK